MVSASRIELRWSGGSGWTAAVAGLGWTVFAFLLLVFNPGSDAVWRAFSNPPFTCGRLVGHSAACDQAIAALNDVQRWMNLYPTLAFIALGYVAIVVVALRGRRRRA